MEGVLRRIPALAAILSPEVFARVHLGEWGNSIEWLDEEFGVDNVYAWAKEQAGDVSHEMFGDWMHRNQLSLSLAAEALGIGRRMVSYYRTAHKPIPRALWKTKPRAHSVSMGARGRNYRARGSSLTL